MAPRRRPSAPRSQPNGSSAGRSRRRRQQRRGAARAQSAAVSTGGKIGFGMSVPRSLDTMYTGAHTGGVTTYTELGLSVTDFFDYAVYDAAAGGIPQTVTHYFWNVKQNLFDNGSQSPELDANVTFCRPRKVHVYVLPVKGFEIGVGTGPNNTNALGMFTVQAQCPGLGSNLSGNQAFALDNQVTNVLPQVDTFWKKVFTCDYDQTFQSGVARPYYAQNFPSNMCLFSMAIVDPTDGDNYLPATDAIDLTIRVKVVIEVDQPVSTVQNASLAVFRNETFLSPSLNQNGGAFLGAADSYVQTNLVRVRDSLR